MSADQQLALARTTRGESTHLSRTAAKVVPPFLQKLYEIVNDPKNDELIRWSDNGDSFYVLNHERFAREVLGRWFKHQKFTSFVRQLNMYGFHKIPHLQQGVLRSESDTEPWHFEHPHFHRGQPDLLCLIQRKKQPAHGGLDDIGVDLNETGAPGVPNLTPGQLLDIGTIMNGISAIKRHQQAISADLNELKNSNQHLWQEALAARERHKKHQDTINRILKFLAGVFGNSADTVKHDSAAPTHVMARNRQRLMISGGDIPEKRKAPLVEEVDDDDDRQSVRSDGGRSVPLYATIESADTMTSPQSPSVASIAPSEGYSPMMTDIPSYRPSPAPTLRPSEALSRSTSEPARVPSTNGQYAAKNDRDHVPTQPSQSALMHVANPQNANGNNEWSSTLQGLLNSPQQLQRLMQALATQQNQPLHMPPMPPPDVEHQTLDPRATAHQVTPYDPIAYDSFRFHDELPTSTTPTAPTNRAQSAALAPSLLGQLSQKDDDGPALEPLVESASRLQKSYRDATEIDADVDALQLSLNTLINGLGLDASSMATAPPAPEEATAPHIHDSSSTSVPPSAGIHTDPSGDFDFDAFLNELSTRNGVDPSFADVTAHFDPNAPLDGTTVGDASTDQLTAFLDDVSSANDSLNDSLDMQTKSSIGVKRKSDVAELPLPILSDNTSPVPKPKRKR